MKITRTNSIKDTFSSPNRVKRKTKNFSSEFQFSNQQEKKKYLKNLLNKIDKKGKHIVTTQNIRTITEYKKMIQEYLTLILQSGYEIKKLQHPWDGQHMSIVTIIDEELEELSQLVLTEHKDTLKIINKIDCIQGLLIDAYQ
ncbi:YaaR family protein [Irregularibacter muris]|uniref:YaaR family protein n=1 Tax=Irregularibacter muris TaxID=1796619 RepID=A0AAE3HH56_9FIRM|nr:YaaR family protein [Irregularibacter muris]MCR1898999.1 YaaR family protein [Irregularibacter muris]